MQYRSNQKISIRKSIASKKKTVEGKLKKIKDESITRAVRFIDITYIELLFV